MVMYNTDYLGPDPGCLPFRGMSDPGTAPGLHGGALTRYFTGAGNIGHEGTRNDPIHAL